MKPFHICIGETVWLGAIIYIHVRLFRMLVFRETELEVSLWKIHSRVERHRCYACCMVAKMQAFPVWRPSISIDHLEFQNFAYTHESLADPGSRPARPCFQSSSSLIVELLLERKSGKNGLRDLVSVFCWLDPVYRFAMQCTKRFR
jgi:hypothetical protein